MEDIKISFKITITGDGSKDLQRHLETILVDGIEAYGIITEYDVKEIIK